MAIADMLARVAGRLRDFEPQSVLDQLKQLERDRPDPGESVGKKPVSELMEQTGQLLKSPDVAIRKCLEAVQELDAWYAPLHDRLRNRLLPELHDDLDRLRAKGRLNEDDRLGSVIPKQPQWGLHSAAFELEAAREQERDRACCRSPEVVNAILNHLALLPSSLQADDPDGGEDKSRRVALQYRLADGSMSKPIPANDSDIKVAFAPLAESGDEIELEFPGRRNGRHWYNVRPKDFRVRIREVLFQARNNGAHVVVFPECAIRNDLVPELQAGIKGLAKDSSIVLVVAGISTPPNSMSDRSRNHVLVLDELGRPVLTHDKLARWNLSGGQQSALGIQGVPHDDVLYENIEPGERIEVVELPGLARLIVLICADMSARDPADWLRRNMQLDWTFAPLLDSSTELHRWIGRDGERAARVTRGRVVVTNSMSLQHRYLAANGLQSTDTGVAMFIDGREAPLHYKLMRLPLSAHIGQLGTQEWNWSEWDEVPPPWHESWYHGLPPQGVQCQGCRWFKQKA